MNQFRLCPGVTYRSFPGCAILLDTRRDRYWRVGPEAAKTLDQVGSGSADPLDADQLAWLSAMQLIEPGEYDPFPAAPPLPLATSSAVELALGDAQGATGDLFEIGWQCVVSRHQVRRQPLAMILAAVNDRRERSKRPANTDPFALARCFKRGRRALPLANQCLPDTLAFLRFMARRHHYPHLVFGVEAWPFAAHCWAQSGDMVLNDALDHARRFAPILVV